MLLVALKSMPYWIWAGAGSGLELASGVMVEGNHSSMYTHPETSGHIDALFELCSAALNVGRKAADRSGEFGRPPDQINRFVFGRDVVISGSGIPEAVFRHYAVGMIDTQAIASVGMPSAASSTSVGGGFSQPERFGRQEEAAWRRSRGSPGSRVARSTVD